MAAVARARRHEVTRWFGRCTDTVVASHAGIGRHTVVAELCRRPTRRPVASVAGVSNHQMARRHTGRQLPIMAGFALARPHIGMVIAVAEATASEHASLQIGPNAACFGAHQGAAHHWLQQCSESAVIGVASGISAVVGRGFGFCMAGRPDCYVGIGPRHSRLMAAHAGHSGGFHIRMARGAQLCCCAKRGKYGVAGIAIQRANRHVLGNRRHHLGLVADGYRAAASRLGCATCKRRCPAGATGSGDVAGRASLCGERCRCVSHRTGGNASVQTGQRRQRACRKCAVCRWEIRVVSSVGMAGCAGRNRGWHMAGGLAFRRELGRSCMAG